MKNDKEISISIRNHFLTQKGFPVEVSSAEKPPHNKTPHRHPYFGIVFFENGEGEYFSGFESYPIKPNTLFCFSPDTTHFVKITKPYFYRGVRFSEKFILSSSLLEQKEFFELDFFHNLSDSPLLTLNEEQGYFIKKTLQEMENEYKSAQYGWMKTLGAYLRIILIQLNRILNYENEDKMIKKRTNLAHDFNKLVSKYFLNNRDIAFYAGKLNVSISYLNNSIKQHLGEPPGQIIRNQILLEAKRLLAHSRLNIAEIGYYLRFEDPSYFCRFFKRETQMSPRAFRAHTHEKYHFFTE